VKPRDLHGSASRSLLTIALMFVLLVVGWFVLVIGGAACDENPGQADLCRVVDGNGASAPTLWFTFAAPVMLAAIGFSARRTRTVFLTALCLLLSQLAIIIVTVIVAE
jgi:hypothetical protein